MCCVFFSLFLVPSLGRFAQKEDECASCNDGYYLDKGQCKAASCPWWTAGANAPCSALVDSCTLAAGSLHVSAAHVRGPLLPIFVLFMMAFDTRRVGRCFRDVSTTRLTPSRFFAFSLHHRTPGAQRLHLLDGLLWKYHSNVQSPDHRSDRATASARRPSGGGWITGGEG